MSVNKQYQKAAKQLGAKPVSPGQAIIRSTKPSAVNAHTKQQAANADMAYKQQQDMSQMRKGTKNAINQVIKEGGVKVSGDQRAKIFDELDPKNNSAQRSKKLGY